MTDHDLTDVADLYALFAQVVDPRKPRGIRHKIASVLTIVVFAVLAGARNFREAGDRAADLPVVLLGAARARRHPATGVLVVPSGSTIRRIIEAIDADAVDLLVGRWIADRVYKRQNADDGCGGLLWQAIAIDGKQVRHSAGFDGQNVTLFSAMLHDRAVVIAQMRVPDDTNEITQVKALLDSVDITGAVVTADAAHAQTATATYLRERGAHYVLTVKGNQPTLRNAIISTLDRASVVGCHHTVDRHSGDIVARHIWALPADGIEFPGAAQIFRIRRDIHTVVGELVSTETIHGISSLTVDQAAAEVVAGWVRTHWGIENKIHWVRDVVFAEDHQNAYLGATAQAMALFRNLTIALIRLAGHTQIKRTLEHIAADRTRILPLLAASRP